MMMMSTGITAMLTVLGLFVLVGVVHAEEERVVGLEGTLEQATLEIEERTNASGRSYRVATLRLVLAVEASLIVYEDMSKRTARVENLQTAFAESGRKTIVFTMSDLLDEESEAELARLAAIPPGTKLVVRGPYASLREHIGGKEAATAYLVEE